MYNLWMEVSPLTSPQRWAEVDETTAGEEEGQTGHDDPERESEPFHSAHSGVLVRASVTEHISGVTSVGVVQHLGMQPFRSPTARDLNNRSRAGATCDVAAPDHLITRDDQCSKRRDSDAGVDHKHGADEAEPPHGDSRFPCVTIADFRHHGRRL